MRHPLTKCHTGTAYYAVAAERRTCIGTVHSNRPEHVRERAEMGAHEQVVPPHTWTGSTLRDNLPFAWGESDPVPCTEFNKRACICVQGPKPVVDMRKCAGIITTAALVLVFRSSTSHYGSLSENGCLVEQLNPLRNTTEQGPILERKLCYSGCKPRKRLVTRSVHSTCKLSKVMPPPRGVAE